MENYQIFICYRRDGGDSLAGRLADRLTNLGYKVFFDVEAMRSGKFNEQIYLAIEKCEDVLVVLPPNGLDRCINEEDWVRKELAYALSHKKNVIPILLRNFTFPEYLTDDIKDIRIYHGIPASNEYFDAFIEKLQSLLKSEIVNDSSKKKNDLHGTNLGSKRIDDFMVREKDEIIMKCIELGDFEIEKNNFFEANEWYKKGLEIAEELIKNDSIPLIMNDLSIIYRRLGDLEKKQNHYFKAKEFYMDALDIRMKTKIKNPMSAENCLLYYLELRNLGDFAREQQKYNEAREWYMKGRKVLKDLVNEIPTTENKTVMYQFEEYIRDFEIEVKKEDSTTFDDSAIAEFLKSIKVTQ